MLLLLLRMTRETRDCIPQEEERGSRCNYKLYISRCSIHLHVLPPDDDGASDVDVDVDGDGDGDG